MSTVHIGIMSSQTFIFWPYFLSALFPVGLFSGFLSTLSSPTIHTLLYKHSSSVHGKYTIIKNQEIFLRANEVFWVFDTFRPIKKIIFTLIAHLGCNHYWHFLFKYRVTSDVFKLPLFLLDLFHCYFWLYFFTLNSFFSHYLKKKKKKKRKEKRGSVSFCSSPTKTHLIEGLAKNQFSRITAGFVCGGGVWELRWGGVVQQDTLYLRCPFCNFANSL